MPAGKQPTTDLALIAVFAALIAAFEAEDMTTSSQELACSGGKCDAP